MSVSSLNLDTFTTALHHLGRRDEDLADVMERLGPPPFWTREPGFATLVHIILEQQVSLASARAAFERLQEIATPLTPQRFLGLTDSELRTIGFSRQKTAYGRYLASAIVDSSLNLADLHHNDDDEVRARLCTIKGIGPWTAEIYLLMALRRPDAWPVGDLALATAVHEIKGLPGRPNTAELQRIGSHWQPWRAVATRLLWHHYLS